MKRVPRPRPSRSSNICVSRRAVRDEFTAISRIFAWTRVQARASRNRWETTKPTTGRGLAFGQPSDRANRPTASTNAAASHAWRGTGSIIRRLLACSIQSPRAPGIRFRIRTFRSQGACRPGRQGHGCASSVGFAGRLGQLEPLHQGATDHLGTRRQIFRKATSLIDSFDQPTGKAKVDRFRINTRTTHLFFCHHGRICS